MMRFMVSFDVVSLFTAIPVPKPANTYGLNLKQEDTLTSRTNLTIDDIISLLEFTLSNNYFIYNNVTYKQSAQLWPTFAWNVIETTAIQQQLLQNLKHEKRFVDDSFSIIKKTAISTFHNTLNNIDPNISFTMELEQNNQISFLDTLITRQGNNLEVDIYRKPTHITNRYLDFNSHHDIKHKISTARTLMHRAQTLPLNTLANKTNSIT